MQCNFCVLCVCKQAIGNCRFSQILLCPADATLVGRGFRRFSTNTQESEPKFTQVRCGCCATSTMVQPSRTIECLHPLPHGIMREIHLMAKTATESTVKITKTAPVQNPIISHPHVIIIIINIKIDVARSSVLTAVLIFTRNRINSRRTDTNTHIMSCVHQQLNHRHWWSHGAKYSALQLWPGSVHSRRLGST